MSLFGQISLVSISGLIDCNGLIGFSGLGIVSLVGFIGLSLVSLIGIVGLIGFGLVSLIGLDDLKFIRIFGSSASSAHHLIIFFILVGLSIHWPFKQAEHGVAIKLTSVTEIANWASTCYVTASSFHVHLLLREKMWWWLALMRKKMWWWIASFGESCHEGVWQYPLMDIYNW
jgi:hypothetical protein